MSLTGTIVIQTIGADPPQYRIYTSKLESDPLIESLLQGKNIEVYACADQACLNPKSRAIILNNNQGFIAQVSRIIESMEQKVRADTEPLSSQEQAFVEATALPLYKMLNVYGAFSQGTALLFPTQYAEVIALDIVYRYIDSNIQALSEAAQNPHFPEHLSKDFSKMIQRTQARLSSVRLLQIQKTGTLDDMIAKVQMMEKQITALVSSQIFAHL